MSYCRPLIKSIVPATVEAIMYMQWNQGARSRDLRQAVLSHDQVHAAIERAHAADPQFGHREVNAEYISRRITDELQRKDEFGYRIYVSMYLPTGEGAARERRYVPFRCLRLSELMALIEQEERVALRQNNKVERLHRFRLRLEQCPAGTQVGDVYDDVVRRRAA